MQNLQLRNEMQRLQELNIKSLTDISSYTPPLMFLGKDLHKVIIPTLNLNEKYKNLAMISSCEDYNYVYYSCTDSKGRLFTLKKSVKNQRPKYIDEHIFKFE